MSIEHQRALVLDAKHAGLWPEEAAAVFIDLDVLEARWRRLAAAFPHGTLHAVAIKANPLVEILRALVGWGAGLEAASEGEVRLASAAGCAPQRIVFDSPVKTRGELARALALGIHINADNRDELRRIEALRSLRTTASTIGVRINPEVGAGAIASTSVAVKGGKFGVSLEREGAALQDQIVAMGGVDALHVHVGSQGMGLKALMAGCRRAVEFAESLARRGVTVRMIDIGGGLPTTFGKDVPDDVETYAETLLQELPELSDFQIVTEFGRWVFSPAACAVSPVEYSKPSADAPVALIHFGADLFLRKAYQPATWPHPMSVLRVDDTWNDDDAPVTIGGPLCFAGDVMATAAPLGKVDEGDLFVMHDAGAYTFGMWSRYCSRPFPAIYGRAGGSWRVLRAAETLDDIVKFWS